MDSIHTWIHHTLGFITQWDSIQTGFHYIHGIIIHWDSLYTGINYTLGFIKHMDFTLGFIIYWDLLHTGREREMFYLMTDSTHFIYGYMASDIWLRTILIVRKETRCRHIGYSFRLTAKVLLYAPSHRQDNTYHGLCYTRRGALAGMRYTLGFIKYMNITLGLIKHRDSLDRQSFVCNT